MNENKSVVPYETRLKQREASKKYYHKNAHKIKEKRKKKFLDEEIKKAEIYKKLLQEKIKKGESI